MTLRSTPSPASRRTALAAASRARALALGALGLVLATCGPAQDASGFRHILLISLDTTRADHLGAYAPGRIATPFLDRLASEGVLFRDATAPAPSTLAAHTSIMTGCYPHTHGVPRNNHEVAAENEMLAETLGALGFHTAGVLGSFALERRFQFHQGFEFFDENFDVEVDMSGVDQNQRRAEFVTDAVLAHVDEVRGEGQRLFLFAHYFDAHLPYDPPAPFDAQAVGASALEESSTAVAEQMVFEHQRRDVGHAFGYRPTLVQGLPRDLLDAAVPEPIGADPVLASLYAGEIEYMDGQIGRLIDGLRARGLLDETLVVVTGDHGETFWEHPDYWNHGSWVYQTTLHVPLMMRFPDGRGAGRVVEQPVSTIDIVPTLCALLAAPQPARVEGVSLLPAIDGLAFERGDVFGEATQPYAAEAGDGWTNARKAHCIRAGKWKYIDAPYVEGGGYEQLFDLEQDPGEHVNLLRPQPSEPLRAVRDELAERLRAFEAAAAPLPVRLNQTQQEDTRKRLEALGYLGYR